MAFQRILKDDEHLLRLFKDVDTNEVYLEATCGGIAWGTIGVKLTREEYEEYVDNPGSIARLARDVCDRPSYYKDRLVTEDVLREWNA